MHGALAPLLRLQDQPDMPMEVYDSPSEGERRRCPFSGLIPVCQELVGLPHAALHIMTQPIMPLCEFFARSVASIPQISGPASSSGAQVLLDHSIDGVRR